MRIAIIDADLVGRKKHRFPNLACMKISGYYKRNGHTVELKLDYENLDEYDKVFISKVFLDTEVPQEVLTLSNVEYGGTGFFYDKAAPLPPHIEHSFPDYDLYAGWVIKCYEAGVKPKELVYYTDYSIGFTTRGCIRGCSFCVNKNYRQCIKHSPVAEFLDANRKYICLLDDNVLSCRDWKEIFAELNATGKRFQFKQGMDERLLTDEKCDVVFNSNWIGDYIFAFDNIKDRRIVEKKLDLIRKHTNKVPKFYCFCGFNHESPDEYPDDFWTQDIADLFERIKILISRQCLPYIMRYKDYEKSPYRGMYITIARWCNQPSFFKKKSFREFAAVGGASSQRYAEAFEIEHPDIAAKYYDMKFEDFR